MGNNLQCWRPTHSQWLKPTIVRPGRRLGLCNLQVRSVQRREGEVGTWLYMGVVYA